MSRLAFVAPRLTGTGAAGGAETLIKSLAEHAARAGHDVHYLTTCAISHVTWANERPAGSHREGPVTIHCFPVDENRNIDRFLRAQERISRGRFEPDDETAWLAESVNSKALLDYAASGGFDRIVVGPYLFGLTVSVCRRFPKQAYLLPCLHDEVFARVSAFKTLFHEVAGILFNAAPERDLARRLYDLPGDKGHVVGMGLDPFEADPTAFARKHNLQSPYIVYCGRREPLKGTPLLVDYVKAFRARTERDVKLVLTGSGDVPIPSDLRQHVLDAGFVSEQEKHEAMAGAVAFCHPSMNESFSIVLLEAWLARTPALVREACAVLQDHCRRSRGGLWFTRYGEFEDALNLLLDRTEVRKAMGQAGRRYVEREYAWPVVERKLFDALGV